MTTTAIAKALWFAGLVVWIAIRYPHQRKRPRLGFDRSVGGRQDRILLLIAALGQFIVPLVYVATGFPAAADYPLAAVQGGLGAAALVASLILFRVTHKQLGQNWSVSLDTRQGHELVTGGLYAWVRHPMYSSFFLSAVAQLLLLPNWIAGPAGLIGIGLLFGFRVKREEQLMIETFGEAYRAYMRRTARIVPGVY